MLKKKGGAGNLFLHPRKDLSDLCYREPVYLDGSVTTVVMAKLNSCCRRPNARKSLFSYS